MAKRRGSKRRRPAPRPKPVSTEVRVPSAQSLFRFQLTDPQTRDLMRKTLSRLKPILWMRDREKVNQIERARTAEEVLDLVPLARGLGETTWHNRMRRFGPEVVPLISERLKTVGSIRGRATRDMTLEKFIAELRWRDEAGAEVLLERFDDLDDYGKSLACVVLGLLGARASADKLWDFYQKVARKRREEYFIGPLWGLIDLKDERAGGALADLLSERRDFYELFGFLSRAGDARAVIPLMTATTRMPEERRSQAIIAMLSIAHRIGRDALVAEFDKVASPEESRKSLEAAADQILARPASLAEEYFASFYRGLTPDDVAQVFPGRIGR